LTISHKLGIYWAKTYTNLRTKLTMSIQDRGTPHTSKFILTEVFIIF